MKHIVNVSQLGTESKLINGTSNKQSLKMKELVEMENSPRNVQIQA